MFSFLVVSLSKHNPPWPLLQHSLDSRRHSPEFSPLVVPAVDAEVWEAPLHKAETHKSQANTHRTGKGALNGPLKWPHVLP